MAACFITCMHAVAAVLPCTRSLRIPNGPELQMLASQAEHFRERPFSWLWAEGGQQPALEASLGVGGFG